ncbi:DUF202 domain-containing protein [Micromonospora auratinigra]|uniref:DUF202 domain-containing protein n=1 Tax=Micromonospora auratinigra TaxID=261654 RepID=A0A1A9A9X1_9ACTN|nr:DUF202 domain-containing protein [Micromonospora auratinigra]SBT52903.1 protein of unknown function (DUF202) [Micromonospora auratinigra]
MSRDPGLQPERTRLAWRRTLLALTGVTVLELRLAFTGDRGDALLAGVAVAGWLTVLGLDWRRATGTGTRRGHRWSFPLTALAAAGLALLGVLHVLRGLR